MPRLLTDKDVTAFRDRLCRVAERLFAARGPDAVTLREICRQLGVSPMTPYRYFQGKADIVAAVRARAFKRFADVLEGAYETAPAAPEARSRAVGDAYVSFALEQPDAYRLMFETHSPPESSTDELREAVRRARQVQTRHIEPLVEAGLLQGDTEDLGLIFWAATHGAVDLALSGKLAADRAQAIHRALFEALSRSPRRR